MTETCISFVPGVCQQQLLLTECQRVGYSSESMQHQAAGSLAEHNVGCCNQMHVASMSVLELVPFMLPASLRTSAVASIDLASADKSVFYVSLVPAVYIDTSELARERADVNWPIARATAESPSVTNRLIRAYAI